MAGAGAVLCVVAGTCPATGGGLTDTLLEKTSGSGFFGGVLASCSGAGTAGGATGGLPTGGMPALGSALGFAGAFGFGLAGSLAGGVRSGAVMDLLSGSGASRGMSPCRFSFCLSMSASFGDTGASGWVGAVCFSVMASVCFGGFVFEIIDDC